MAERKFGAGIRYALIVICFFMLLVSCREECPDGFYGEDCEMRESDKFLGVYEGTLNCGFDDQFTTLEIERNLGAFDIYLLMTYPNEFILNARVHEDSIFIDQQTSRIPVGQGDTLDYNFGESFGLLSNDTLNFPIVFLVGEEDPEEIICRFEVIK